MGKACVLCEGEALIDCGGCGQVLYCCDDHKKKHSTEHKSECKPYRVEKNDKYGRFLVTSRTVRQGEPLLRERPLVVGPRVDSLPACLECLTLLGLPPPRCPVCHVTPLCTKCSHDPVECQFYSSLSEDLQDTCVRASNQHVLPLKILLQLKANPQHKYRAVLDMEAHLEDRRGTHVWISHRRNVVELLQILGVVGNSAAEVEQVQQICGALDVNSFEVRGAAGLAGAGMRLRGVYPHAALMAHSCLANVHLSVDDNFIMTIRAAVDIPQGQPILYNYTDPLQTTGERKKHLKEGKYFSCECPRCEDPTELGTYMGALLCPRCRQGQVLRGNDCWTCNNCNHEYSSGMISVAVALARDRLESVDRSDPSHLEAALRRLSLTFHPAHSVMVDVKQSIVAAYRELEDQPTRDTLERKIALCRELVPLINIIEPGISRLKGITLYELHVSLVSMAQHHGQPQLFTEAEGVLREAVSLLLYEPSDSPEGELARQAMHELKMLKQIIAKQDKKNQKMKKKK